MGSKKAARRAAKLGNTVAQLRHDIDSGRTSDKVPGLDLAAAPLGTDDEAAGTPPTPEAIAQARGLERRGTVRNHPNGANPALAPDARGASRVYLGWIITLSAALVVACITLVLAAAR